MSTLKITFTILFLFFALKLVAQEAPAPAPAPQAGPYGGGMVGGSVGEGGGFPSDYPAPMMNNVGLGGFGLGGMMSGFGIPDSTQGLGPSKGDIGSSSLNRNCRPRGSNFACGECEQGLQNQFNDLIADITGQPRSGDHWSDSFGGKASIRPGVTLESTLARIKDMMKSNNPAGGNGLNFIVIGESESLQPTTVRDGKMYPRIALKSPNSELWVTFNTDPNEPTYSTLEIMRWNGKEAKYEFMELDFDQNKRHMDGTGEKCISCHKQPDPRPNWDTYRAWSGVVPSRDDMLEMHARDGEYVQGKGRRMGTDGRAYLSFLDQVVTAKESNPNDRLAMLDIPMDPQVQFAGRKPPVTDLTAREQVELIRRQTEERGFYRIPHYPFKEGLGQSNFDDKTAQYTGPSQAAFDQMSGQNFCRISTRLKEHPDYNKFKYYLAGLGERSCKDSMLSGEQMEQWMPESYRARIMSHFSSNPAVTLRNLNQVRKPTGFRDFNGLMQRLNEDTTENHSQADRFKVQRHRRFLNSYLRNGEGLIDHAQSSATSRSVVKSRPGSKTKAKDVIDQEANYFAQSLTAPQHSGFHAINDFGGVKGVAEASGPEISSLRALLSPLGIDVGQWSMMRGDDPNYDSLAFSDQFVLLYQQAAVQDVLAEVRNSPEFRANGGDICRTLQQKSYQALADPVQIEQTGPLANQFEVESWCRERIEAESLGESLGFSDNMKDVFRVSQNMMGEEAKTMTETCFMCHGKQGFSKFPGMDKLSPGQAWTDEAWQEFQAALRGEGGNRQFPLGPKVIDKMILKLMPPGGWRVGENPAQMRLEDNRRRDYLANYVKVTMVTSNNDEAIQSYCRSIVSGDQPDSSGIAPAPQTQGGAVEQ